MSGVSLTSQLAAKILRLSLSDDEMVTPGSQHPRSQFLKINVLDLCPRYKSAQVCNLTH